MEQYVSNSLKKEILIAKYVLEKSFTASASVTSVKSTSGSFRAIFEKTDAHISPFFDLSPIIIREGYSLS